MKIRIFTKFPNSEKIRLERKDKSFSSTCKGIIYQDALSHNSLKG